MVPVTRPYYGEVAAIQGGDPGLVEFFAGRDDAGIDQTEIERDVLALDCGGPGERVLGERVESIRARGDVLDERLPRFMSIEVSRPGSRLRQVPQPGR